MSTQYGDFAANPFLFGDPDLLELGIALDFGPEELASNAEGYLTLAQIRRLEKDLRWKYWPLIIGFTLLVLFIGCSGLVLLPARYLMIIPVTVLMTEVTLIAVFHQRERESLSNCAVWSTRVEVGRVALTLRRWGLVYGSKLGRAFFVGTNGQKLFAPSSLQNAMQANQTYRAYYVYGISWSGARILSMEPIVEQGYSQEKVKVKQKPKAKRKRIPFNE